MTDFSRVLAGQFMDVTVSLGNATKTKKLKICKINTRTILFIEIDKTLRLNTFYKFPRKEVLRFLDNLETPILEFNKGVMPEKWESNWDNIGNVSRMAAGSFAYTPRPSYNYGGGAHFRT